MSNSLCVSLTVSFIELSVLHALARWIRRTLDGFWCFLVVRTPAWCDFKTTIFTLFCVRMPKPHLFVTFKLFPHAYSTFLGWSNKLVATGLKAVVLGNALTCFLAERINITLTSVQQIWNSSQQLVKIYVENYFIRSCAGMVTCDDKMPFLICHHCGDGLVMVKQI